MDRHGGRCGYALGMVGELGGLDSQLGGGDVESWPVIDLRLLRWGKTVVDVDGAWEIWVEDMCSLRSTSISK